MGARQKQSPSWFRQLVTVAGAASMHTPSCSRTSADPVRLDTARLPCLAIGRPAAATTIAAAVEMLNEPEPSPPVPQVSAMTACWLETLSIFPRSDVATPAISSADSPASARATSQRPNAARSTVPSNTWSTSSRVSLRPAWMPRRILSRKASLSTVPWATRAGSEG